MKENENNIIFIMVDSPVAVFLNYRNINDEEWNELQRQSLIEYGKVLHEEDKNKFILIFSLEDGFVWVEKEIVFKFRLAINPEYKQLKFILSIALNEEIHFENNNYYFNISDYIENKHEYSKIKYIN